MRYLFQVYWLSHRDTPLVCERILSPQVFALQLVFHNTDIFYRLSLLTLDLSVIKNILRPDTRQSHDDSHRKSQRFGGGRVDVSPFWGVRVCTGGCGTHVCHESCHVNSLLINSFGCLLINSFGWLSIKCYQLKESYQSTIDNRVGLSIIIDSW